MNHIKNKTIENKMSSHVISFDLIWVWFGRRVEVVGSRAKDYSKKFCTSTSSLSPFPQVLFKHDELQLFWLLPDIFPSDHLSVLWPQLGLFFPFHPFFFCCPVLNNTARFFTAWWIIAFKPTMLQEVKWIVPTCISRGKLSCAHITIGNFPIKLIQNLPICLWSMSHFHGFSRLFLISCGHLRNVLICMHKSTIIKRYINCKNTVYISSIFLILRVQSSVSVYLSSIVVLVKSQKLSLLSLLFSEMCA